ncbi:MULTISPECIES: hypothetical protein [unclassified Anaerobiospirillum]|uniref:hypothetical protein n=1 Tax=unclassified Anaerobiospirillum TaxID=2647410 RepID=UPI001FF395C7|nr:MULTISPECIES: hypothetical protein [unclassified Anaerobiospirillum]MCK0525474.1 hypothetical protein [Anaerobiospirillum sp. NML120449]MCK0534109.1 hypothetical protein [Anaerobiospirillum sp. NML120511]
MDLPGDNFTCKAILAPYFHLSTLSSYGHAHAKSSLNGAGIEDCIYVAPGSGADKWLIYGKERLDLRRETGTFGRVLLREFIK